MIDLAFHIITGALTGLLFALISMGFVIIYRSARVFNLAQGEVVMVGAFLLWTASQHWNWPIWLSVVFALTASMILGLLIERIILRPLIGEDLFALIMVTIGLMVFVRGFALVIWGGSIHFIPPIFPFAGFKLGPFILDRGLVIGGITTIILAVLVSWFFSRTRTGMAMSAVAEDHQIALSLGLSVKRSIAAAWAVSGALCTAVAIFFLSGKGMSFLVSDIGLAALPVAILAGLESISGLVLAGLIIGVSIGVAEYLLDPIFQGGVASIFPYVIMLIVLLIRPSGLFGWKTIERI
ncbi:MAG: branched-chain amino acid ABC transporter permease [Deltaproteobacteria bacterium]|nr:branched-chain amino acid ABC transporter permease [Deltaproteobacteria bacterium]